MRDATGAKMSKSKGNVVDPLGVIDEYGADALRFTLARNVAPGHDIRLGPQDVENNRNFATKLWNAARFVEIQRRRARRRLRSEVGERNAQSLDRARDARKAAAEITKAIEIYRLQRGGGRDLSLRLECLLRLVSRTVEAAADRHRDGAAKDETRAMAAWALDEILKLLHPFMPFITEELWAVTAEQGPKRASLLALSDWPKLDGLADDKAEAEIGWVIDLSPPSARCAPR